eukprot:CAMPEP_0176449820 /NCGR_PEP_ID=MMETSP0127-20121128/26738_1 /TAXON_ID=938130 /ORGANISM="Platyophrya macrostoma, Strain WH" /LENGTH=162 /DNA_ID=CAMNT_0017837297 /DNA_START=21 /DNA_END=509 /DNA_ORIENTATION=+
MALSSLEAQMKELFETYDTDKSGFIDMNELVKFVKEVGDKIGEPIPESACEGIMKDFDTNSDGKLSFEELSPILMKVVPKLVIKSRTKALFDSYDTDKSGFIELNEYKVMVHDLLKKLGIEKKFDENEYAEKLQQWDKDNDGKLSYEECEKEFENILSKLDK